jgi:hypothetical protein
MIHFYRAGAVAPGKLASALGFAKEISSYLKEKHGVAVTVAMPVGGNPNRIGWSTTYDSLGALETAMTRMMGDAAYMDILRKGADNFIAGSIRDEIWRSV